MPNDFKYIYIVPERTSVYDALELPELKTVSVLKRRTFQKHINPEYKNNKQALKGKKPATYNRKFKKVERKVVPKDRLLEVLNQFHIMDGTNILVDEFGQKVTLPPLFSRNMFLKQDKEFNDIVNQRKKFIKDLSDGKLCLQEVGRPERYPVFMGADKDNSEGIAVDKKPMVPEHIDRPSFFSFVKNIFVKVPEVQKYRADLAYVREYYHDNAIKAPFVKKFYEEGNEALEKLQKEIEQEERNPAKTINNQPTKKNNEPMISGAAKDELFEEISALNQALIEQYSESHYNVNNLREGAELCLIKETASRVREGAITYSEAKAIMDPNVRESKIADFMQTPTFKITVDELRNRVNGSFTLGVLETTYISNRNLQKTNIGSMLSKEKLAPENPLTPFHLKVKDALEYVEKFQNGELDMNDKKVRMELRKSTGAIIAYAMSKSLHEVRLNYVLTSNPDNAIAEFAKSPQLRSMTGKNFEKLKEFMEFSPFKMKAEFIRSSAMMQREAAKAEKEKQRVKNAEKDFEKNQHIVWETRKLGSKRK